MKCFECGNDAVAICKFCGRGVCKEHVRENLFTSGFSAEVGFWDMRENALRVRDAVWCGLCHPEHRATS